MLPFVYVHLLGGADPAQDWFEVARAQVSVDFSFQRPIQVLFALWVVLPLAWFALGASFLVFDPARFRIARLHAIAGCGLALASTLAYGWETAMFFGLPAFLAVGHYRASSTERLG